ncbi:MMPL family transporter [Natronococcus roseus]|uniref:MMPL family transporter n=1 Tax=Natronococcus roseus TaxID=1052014 RepID=UPI00374D8CA7
MSLPYRLSELITSYSKIVIVALLLTTALVGAGMPMVDDDSSLDQFEGESAEAEALEEMDDNFAAEGDENTTSVQLIHRDEGGNVLTQESLITSLEFQQEIRDNESINATLADDDPITGVENILAMTAITNEEIDELEERGEELEDREAELEDRSDVLEEGIDDVTELQREYEEASADGDEAAADEIDAEIEAAIDGAVDEAELDADQADEYEEFAEDAREVETNRWMLERQAELPPEELPEYQELNEALEEVYTGATVGVLAEEFEQLEEDAAELEEEQQELESQAEALEQQEAELEAQTETLQSGLEEVIELEYQYELASAAGDDDEAAAAEAEIETVTQETIAEADLDDEQAAEYEAAVESARDEITVSEEELAELAGGDAAELEAQQAELESQAEALEQQEAELEAQTETLQSGLEEVIELEYQYELASAAGDEAAATDAEAEIEATIDETVAEADLDDEQAAEYEAAVETARDEIDADDAGAGADELQTNGAELEAQQAELEERGDDLADREAELEERVETLEDGLLEIVELRAELAATDDEATAEAIEDEIEATIDETIADADLNGQQAAEFEALAETDPDELESAEDDLEADDGLEALAVAAAGVLDAEFNQLEDDAAELEDDQEALEAEAAEFEDAAGDDVEEQLEPADAGLEPDEDELEAVFTAATAGVLEEEFAALEAQATELEEQQEALEAEAAELEDAADADPDEFDPAEAGIGPDEDELEAVFTAATAGVLDDEIAELEAEAAELEEGGQELEEDGQELEQRESELDDRATTLEDGLDEVVELQREYEEASEAGDDETAAEIEAEIEATIEETATEAELDAEQTDQYTELAEQAREIESNRFAIEEMPDDPEESPEYQELEEALEGIYAGATMGVLEDEYEQLGDDAEALEDDWDEFEEDDETPSLDEQIEALEDLDDEEFEDLIQEVLDEDDGNEGAGLGFMPSDYEPGSTEADARMTMVAQETAGADDMEMGGEMDATLETQLDLRDLATQHEQEYVVFGAGIITDEIENSMGDSLAIVGPLALLFVVGALAVAYRDPLDIVLGVVGIGGVLIWTFGFMGWAGIAFNQMMIAVPVLLIGLSIDYAIHVFMRHREQREAEGKTSTVRGSMAIALAGVGVALVWVTATTAIGFLANLVSPIAPIQEFGIVSAFGILAALIIFGALIPALKVEIDSLLESRGWDRRKRAFGTREGGFTSALTLGSSAARKIPVIVLIAALLLTAGGVYGATQVDTSFEEEDFLAESPPGWTEHLPGSMAPGEYQAADDLEYINDNFQREDTEAQILVEGGITDDGALQQLNETQDEASQSDVVYTLPNGEADVEGPLSVMDDTAAENESFNESFQDADTTGDGTPDQDVEALYDELFEVNEDEASTVIHRTDGGEYESVRLIVATDGGANVGDVTTELRSIAGDLDAAGAGDERNLDASDGELNAFATGDPIVNYIVEQDLLETVLQSLMITLVAVFAFLTVAYKLTGNSASLGAVTLLPVAFAVSWILGTMYLLGMPFNVLTGMITSLTIGLGVAYSIHVSARYTLELERQGNVWSAMHTTVTGTGGALLGSAATTVGGFGTLAFAILPALRQFGIITGMTIIYSFLASVIVLPTLLVLWTRYFGPDVSFDRSRVGAATPAASDGGTEMETDTVSEHAGEDEP